MTDRHDVGDETPPEGRSRFGRRRPSREMRDRADEMADLLDRAAPAVRARTRRRSLGVPAAVVALGALAAGGVGVALGIDAQPTGTDVGTGTAHGDDSGAGLAIPDTPIAPPVDLTSTPSASRSESSDTPTSTRRADLVNEQSRVAAAERPRAAPTPRARPSTAPAPARPLSTRPAPRPTSTRATTTTSPSTTTTTPRPSLREDPSSTTSSRSSPARSAPAGDESRATPGLGETLLTPSSPTIDQQ